MNPSFFAGFSLFILTIFISPLASAGAISGGGGNTTSPNAANAEWIAELTESYAAKVIDVWLNREKDNFLRLSIAEQATRPNFKMFRGKSDIFEILKATRIELRMNSPCFDEKGSPKDGSVDAKHPNSICISPLLMNKKLNEFNVVPETLALIVHELSHLIGTTEEEAVYVQETALRAFYRIDVITVDETINTLARETQGGGMQDALLFLNGWIKSPKNISVKDFDRWSDRIDYIERKVNFSQPPLLYISSLDNRLLGPNKIRIDAAKYYIGLHDPIESHRFYRKLLAKGFAGKTKITSRAFYLALNGQDFGDDYDKVEFKPIKVYADLSNEILQLRNYFENLQTQMLTLNDLYFVSHRSREN